jgi:hypothetical protein
LGGIIGADGTSIVGKQSVTDALDYLDILGVNPE